MTATAAKPPLNNQLELKFSPAMSNFHLYQMHQRKKRSFGALFCSIEAITDQYFA